MVIVEYFGRLDTGTQVLGLLLWSVGHNTCNAEVNRPLIYQMYY